MRRHRSLHPQGLRHPRPGHRQRGGPVSHGVQNRHSGDEHQPAAAQRDGPGHLAGPGHLRRGPAVLDDVLWNCDYLFVDMPPGTGDVSLSVFQSIPLDGIVIVASPQELVSMVVEKAVKMAEMMEVPIVGLVENMSYVTCPDCGKQIHLFGQGKTAELRSATICRAGGDAHRPTWPPLPTPETSSPSRAAGWSCRRQAGGEIMLNAAPCPSTARRLPRFVRPMQIHRRKHLLFVGKNSCKIRQDSR